MGYLGKTVVRTIAPNIRVAWSVDEIGCPLLLDSTFHRVARLVLVRDLYRDKELYYMHGSSPLPEERIELPAESREDAMRAIETMYIMARSNK